MGKLLHYVAITHHAAADFFGDPPGEPIMFNVISANTNSGSPTSACVCKI